jgi:hypothetical protein
MGSIPKTHPTLFYTIPIGICGFLGFLGLGSGVTQRISSGDNCERFVHFFAFFFFETKAGRSPTFIHHYVTKP